MLAAALVPAQETAPGSGESGTAKNATGYVDQASASFGAGGEKPAYRSDRIIVRPRGAAAATATPGALARPTPSSAAREQLLGSLGVARERVFSALGGIEVLKVPAGSTPDAIITRLRASGLYAYAEPDYVLHAYLTPDDPKYLDGTTWDLNNTGQSAGVNDADIDAPEAWDLQTDASSVIVGVVDTGIRLTHVDLAANLWTNPGEIPGNGIDDDGDGVIDDVHGYNAIDDSGDPSDDNGHGSHCSGTIGAVGNNGLGHPGIAWHVQLMALKFLDADGGGATSDAIACIDYARAHGARILSNSWGGGGRSRALYDAIAACRDAGILFVAAAGNESSDNDSIPNYPSNYLLENVVAVAATTRTDSLADYSNTGYGLVQLAAPGSEIYSTVASSDTAHDIYSGTSMATPHVAGTLALLTAHFPADTPLERLHRLLRGVDLKTGLAGKVLTGGRLNAYGALTTPLATPPNDAFNSAPALPSSRSIYLRTDNASATAETGEPSHAGVAATRSIWWSWTAPSSGPVVFSTAGSSFDTTIAVYTGTSISALQEVASNDDASTELTTSRVLFTAIGGTTYRIAVDGKSGASGLVLLRVATPPANDAFSAAITLTGLPASATSATNGASRESGEPQHAGVLTGSASVWWSWTAPSSGPVAVSTTGSTFDTLLAVYTGASVSSLTTVASSDDISDYLVTSQLRFDAIAGTTYRIAVDGKDGASGTVALTIITPPANDNFADRITIPATSATTQGSNVGATHEPGEPEHADPTGSASVWWSWTAPATGTYVLSTSGSTYDTLMAVYTGTSLTDLAKLAENDDASYVTRTSSVTLQATQGTTYQIAVDGWGGDTGSITLYIHGSAAPPANDDFADAILIPSEGGGGAADTTRATAETGEPSHDGYYASHSVWWNWTAPAAGKVVASTAGSSFNTVLAIYTGTSVSTLTKLVSNNDADGLTTSRVTFGTTAGTTYRIAVDGYQTAKGNVALTLTFTANNTPPSITAVSLSPASEAFADEPVSVAGITASDPEGDAITYAYRWQSSLDGANWSDESGATTDTLYADDSHAGKFWRLRITPADYRGEGSLFTTDAVAVRRRPIATARPGDVYSYQPAFPLLQLQSAFSRAACFNEFSQGSISGTADWIEILILEDSDVRNWSLAASASGTSIKFSVNQSLWSALPAGTLVVVYNPSSKDTVLPALDVNASDHVVVVAGGTPYFTGTWPGISNTSQEALTLLDSQGTLVDGLSINGNTAQAPALGPVRTSKAAYFDGASESAMDDPTSWVVTSSAAGSVTPGAANSTTNAGLINLLRAGPILADSSYSLAEGDSLPPGLSLDTATGGVSGTIDPSASGLYTFTLTRASADSSTTHTVQLLVGDAAGVYRVPEGATWTLSGDTEILGALVADGAIDAAGHTLSVQRTLAAWAEVHGLAVPSTNTDTDADGLSDIAEFAFGGDPQDPLSKPAPSLATVDGQLRLTFDRQFAPRQVTYTPEWSTDLVNWTAFDADTAMVGGATPMPDDFESITVAPPTAATQAASPHLYLRVRVTAP